MPPRMQVDSGLKPERLRPSAAPVDTFTQPTAGSELARLAQGLRQFAPSLDRFTDVLAEKDAAKQTEKGAQKARELEEARITYKEAIKKGLISASDSPWFQVGAKQQFGRAAAGQYARALQAAIEEDPNMQASTDPADFDKFEQKFRQDWLEQNVGENRDTHFEKGFQIVDGYTMDEGRKFIAAAGGRLEKRAGETFGVLVGQVLDQHWKEGVSVVAGLINAEMKAYLVDNPKGGRIANLRAVEAVADWARLNYKTLDQEQLGALLKQIDAGPGSKLFGTHEARQMLAEVGDQMVSLRQRDFTQANERDRVAKKEQENTVFRGLTQLFQTQNPQEVNLTPFIEIMKRIDPSPEGVGAIYRLQDVFVKAKSEGDPVVFRDALMRVYGLNNDFPGELTMRQAADLAAAGKLSAAQYSQVVNEIGQRDSGQASGPDKVGGTLFNQFRGILIKKMRVTEFGQNEPEDVARAAEAEREFLKQFIENRGKITPELLDKMVNNIAITHLSDEQLSTDAAAKSQVSARSAESKGFAKIIKDMAPSDVNVLSRIRDEVDLLDKRKLTAFSDSTIRWLWTKGIEADREAVKRFLLEYQNQ